MKRILIALACITALSGCLGSNQPQVVARPILPPDALLTCRVSPPVPRDAETQREVARYIVRLHEAGADCRAKLAAVRSWAAENAE